MSDVTKTIQDHYTQGSLLEHNFAFLAENGIDPAELTFEDLYPIDQLHARGVVATKEHIEFAGIGGASRVIASSRQCTVTGIDLTPEYVEIARDLTRRCGLADRIDYRQANALDLPFADESFDHVLCQNVTMNIGDKAGLATAIARVLKPGGHYSCIGAGLGPAGEPSFPLPWARNALSSFLMTQDDMCAALESGGLRVIRQVDLDEVILAFRKDMQARAERGELPLTASYVAMGDDMPEIQGIMGRMAVEGRFIEYMILAEKS